MKCVFVSPSTDLGKQGLILEVSRIRSLSQELSSAYLLVELNMSTPEALLEGGGEGLRGKLGSVMDLFSLTGFIVK